MPMRPEPAHVVDQHVQPRVGVEYRGGQAADLGLRRHVGGETRPPPDCPTRRGYRARTRSRPVMATRAPRVARPTAVALPMPAVPPVTRTFLPVMRCVPVIADSSAK